MSRKIMVFIQKIPFDKGVNKTKFEQAIKKLAVKKNFSLDLTPDAYEYNTQNKFWEYQEATGLEFTRMRTSAEAYFPRLIVHVPNEEYIKHYQIRLSWMTATVILFLIFIIPLLIWGIIANASYQLAFMTICAAGIGYLLYIFAELYYTKRDIEIAIRNSTENTEL